MFDAPGSTSGFLHTFRRLVETFVAIVESRLELASVEVREEKARAALMLVLAVVAFFGAGMAALTVTALVVVLSGAHAAWALGGFAVFYSCLGFLGWRALRRELQKPFFADTIAQLKKDREWLIPRS